MFINFKYFLKKLLILDLNHQIQSMRMPQELENNILKNFNTIKKNIIKKN